MERLVAACLADLVLLLHTAYAAFVVLALPYILLGAWRGWPFVRSFALRAVHLVMMGVVALEAALGVACPLTTLENALRASAGLRPHEGSFIASLAYRLMYFKAPAWIFDALHIGFFTLLVATFVFAPPRRSAGANPKGGL